MSVNRKKRHSTWLYGMFAFIFISLTAYNSYASVCFLPTCEDKELVDYELESWTKPVCTGDDCQKCPDGYTEGTCPSGKTCNTQDGCYKIIEEQEPTCTTSCTANEHQTCTTDSDGCSVVDKDCGVNYLDATVCSTNNNNVTCIEDENGCYYAKNGGKICPENDTNAYDNLDTCENVSKETTCVQYSTQWDLCYKEIPCTTSNETCEKCINGGDCENNCPVGYSLNCTETTSTICTSHSIITACKVAECDTDEGWTSTQPGAEKAYETANGCYKVTGCATGYETSCPEGKICTETNGCYQATACDEANEYYATCPEGKVCETVNECYKVTGDEDSECPSDKICFRFNYTCDGQKCTETYFNELKYVDGDGNPSETCPDTIEENGPCTPASNIDFFAGDISTNLVDDTVIANNSTVIFNIDKTDVEEGNFSFGMSLSFSTIANDPINITQIGNYTVDYDVGDVEALVTYNDGVLTLSENGNTIAEFQSNIIDIDVILWTKADCTDEKRNIIIYATCNKLSEIACPTNEGAYIFDEKWACDELNRMGCISPESRIRYTYNNEIKETTFNELTPDETTNLYGKQIYKDDNENEFYACDTGEWCNLDGSKGSPAYTESLAPTNKFRYVLSGVNYCNIYNIDIKPLRRMFNAEGRDDRHIAFREFVFNDLRYTTSIKAVDTNYNQTAESPSNFIITLDNTNTLYPVIDYDYRMFSRVYDVLTTNDIGETRQQLFALTINTPFTGDTYIKLKELSASEAMFNTNIDYSNSQWQKDTVNSSTDLLTGKEANNNLADNFMKCFSTSGDTFDKNSGIYFGDAYYPYNGSNCVQTGGIQPHYEEPYFAFSEISGLDIKGLHQLFANKDVTTVTGKANICVKGTPSVIWGNFYPYSTTRVSYDITEEWNVNTYNEDGTPNTVGTVETIGAYLRCMNASSYSFTDGLIDGVYHRYRGVYCGNTTEGSCTVNYDNTNSE